MAGIEHRKHTRLPLAMDVELTLADGSVHKGWTRNISFGGMLVGVAGQLAITAGELLELALIMHSREPRLAIEFECRVVHQGDAGLGLQFIAMDIGVYQHFMNLMVLNSPNPDALLEELRKNPGLLVKNG
ncbi:MAG: hypothetical protein A2521_15465 [Deltaproteobacteria bacterium RIFOXYD12_FULL_57_12]|nr:MAG: hypothetical protein A2521_15465 [Deltaproteobacteria bacterium RIFOXYD12_FULL_57_12]